jgi:ADP-heptose:LPS heptosyltransferase
LVDNLILKRLDPLIGRLLVALVPRAPKRQPAATPGSVLFIRPGGIGDAVLLLPAVLQLSRYFPQCCIEVLAETRNAAVFALCPAVKRVYKYDQPTDLLRVLSRYYDLVIDSEQWHRLSAVVARLIRSRMKIGFATNERSRMFTAPVFYGQQDHEILSFLRLLKPLGIDNLSVDPAPWLQIPPQVNLPPELKLPLDPPFVVLFPGASIVERQWGAEAFAALAERLNEAGYSVVLVGAAPDVAAGEVIQRRLPGAINLIARTSLLQTAAVLNKAVLLVSGDSGVLHLAAGLGVPTLSLFGPGIAAKWAPVGARHCVIDHHLDCSPCTQFGTTPPCPIGARCITEIGVDEVFAAAQDLLFQIQKKGAEDAV